MRTKTDQAARCAIVDITGIDRSTLAEMVRRMLERGLLSRERTEEDQRANAVAISPSGRKALRSARNASDRAEKALLETLPMPDRQKFVRALAQIAEAGESFAASTWSVCTRTGTSKMLITGMTCAGSRRRRQVRRRSLGSHRDRVSRSTEGGQVERTMGCEPGLVTDRPCDLPGCAASADP